MILLEDFAALIGLVFAFLGIGLTLLTRNALFDVAGTALIGLLLVAVAVTLAIETKSLLLGESAGPEVVRRIEQALAGTEGVERVIHMKTMHMGPEEILVAAKIAVSPTRPATEVADDHRPRRGRRSARPSRWSRRSTSSRTSTAPTTSPRPGRNARRPPGTERPPACTERPRARRQDLRRPWLSAAPMDYRVADLSLAELGRKEITLAEHEMPGLMEMRTRFGPSSRSRGRGSPGRST